MAGKLPDVRVAVRRVAEDTLPSNETPVRVHAGPGSGVVSRSINMTAGTLPRARPASPPRPAAYGTSSYFAAAQRPGESSTFLTQMQASVSRSVRTASVNDDGYSAGGDDSARGVFAPSVRILTSPLAEHSSAGAAHTATTICFPACRSLLWDREAIAATRTLSAATAVPLILLPAHLLPRLYQQPAPATLLGRVAVDADWPSRVAVVLEQAVRDGAPRVTIAGQPIVVLTGDASDEQAMASVPLDTLLRASRDRFPVSPLSFTSIRLAATAVRPWRRVDATLRIVAPAQRFTLMPIRLLRVIPTSLALTLQRTGGAAASTASHGEQGFMTMDQGRRLLLMLASDPKASDFPLVGVWIAGLASCDPATHPVAYAACLRFLHGSMLGERVMMAGTSFLLLHYTAAGRAPVLYDVRVSDRTADRVVLSTGLHVDLDAAASDDLRLHCRSADAGEDHVDCYDDGGGSDHGDGGGDHTDDYDDGGAGAGVDGASAVQWPPTPSVVSVSSTRPLNLLPDLHQGTRPVRPGDSVAPAVSPPPPAPTAMPIRPSIPPVRLSRDAADDADEHTVLLPGYRDDQETDVEATASASAVLKDDGDSVCDNEDREADHGSDDVAVDDDVDDVAVDDDVDDDVDDVDIVGDQVDDDGGDSGEDLAAVLRPLRCPPRPVIDLPTLDMSPGTGSGASASVVSPLRVPRIRVADIPDDADDYYDDEDGDDGPGAVD